MNETTQTLLVQLLQNLTTQSSSDNYSKPNFNQQPIIPFPSPSSKSVDRCVCHREIENKMCFNYGDNHGNSTPFSAITNIIIGKWYFSCGTPNCRASFKWDYATNKKKMLKENPPNPIVEKKLSTQNKVPICECGLAAQLKPTKNGMILLCRELSCPFKCKHDNYLASIKKIKIRDENPQNESPENQDEIDHDVIENEKEPAKNNKRKRKAKATSNKKVKK